MNELLSINLQMNCECNMALATLQEAVNDYDVTCAEIRVASLMNPYLTESEDVLCENAVTDLVKKAKDAIAKFFKAIGTFIANIAKKIKEFFTKKKPVEAIEDIQDELKEVPEAANEKVEVFDLTRMTEAQIKHFSEIQELLIKNQTGDVTDEELERINKFYQNEFDDPEQCTTEVPVSKAVEITKKSADFAQKATQSLSEMAAKTKIKAEEALNKAAIAGDSTAIGFCTKIMSRCQQQIAKLAAERVKILGPIEKNIATVEKRIKEIEREVSTNKTDAKYGSNVFKKIGGKIRSKGNDRLEASKKKLEDKLKDLKSDVKDVNRTYDAKVADEQKLYDNTEKKAKEIMASIDKIGSKKL